MTEPAWQTADTVRATEAALEVIHHLEAAHGPLMFFQSAGCCDGGAAMCLKNGEFPLGPQDVRLGEIAGSPFYIDAQLFERSGRPAILVDVAPGAAEGFSLEALEGVHFVTRVG